VGVDAAGQRLRDGFRCIDAQVDHPQGEPENVCPWRRRSRTFGRNLLAKTSRSPTRTLRQSGLLLRRWPLQHRNPAVSAVQVREPALGERNLGGFSRPWCSRENRRRAGSKRGRSALT
jgi:hypothetical protein